MAPLASGDARRELVEQLGERLVGVGEDAERHVGLEGLLEAVAQLHEVERVEAELEQRERRLPLAEPAVQVRCDALQPLLASSRDLRVELRQVPRFESV